MQHLMTNFFQSLILEKEEEENIKNSKFRVSQVSPATTSFDKPRKISQEKTVGTTRLTLNKFCKFMFPSMTVISPCIFYPHNKSINAHVIILFSLLEPIV